MKMVISESLFSYFCSCLFPLLCFVIDDDDLGHIVALAQSKFCLSNWFLMMHILYFTIHGYVHCYPFFMIV